MPAASVLARPALERTILEGLTRRLTLLVAGAGFGKSTLIARLATQRPMAWYAVDASDTQVGALAAGVAEAIRGALPAFGSDVGEVETAATPSSEAEALDPVA